MNKLRGKQPKYPHSSPPFLFHCTLAIFHRQEYSWLAPRKTNFKPNCFVQTTYSSLLPEFQNTFVKKLHMFRPKSTMSEAFLAQENVVELQGVLVPWFYSFLAAVTLCFLLSVSRLTATPWSTHSTKTVTAISWLSRIRTPLTPRSLSLTAGQENPSLETSTELACMNGFC